MKKSVLFFAFVSMVFIASSAQSNSSLKVGDKFKIALTQNNHYRYVKFPKNNFIIKKGGIVDYKKVTGQEVVVTSIKEHKNGKRIMVLKLANGKKFFNSHEYIEAEYPGSLDNSELIKI